MSVSRVARQREKISLLPFPRSFGRPCGALSRQKHISVLDAEMIFEDPPIACLCVGKKLPKARALPEIRAAHRHRATVILDRDRMAFKWVFPFLDGSPGPPNGIGWFLSFGAGLGPSVAVSVLRAVKDAWVKDRNIPPIIVRIEKLLQAGRDTRQSVFCLEPLVHNCGDVAARADAVVGDRVFGVIVHDPDTRTRGVAIAVRPASARGEPVST